MPSSSGSSTIPLVHQATIKIDGAFIDDPTMDKLTEIEVDTSLYVPTMVTLRFNDDDLALVDGTKFGLGKKVVIAFPDPSASNALTDVAEAEIVSIEPEFSEALSTILTIRAYHVMHRLNRGTKTRVFQQMSDSDIVSKILGEASVPKGTVTSTTPAHKYVLQHNQTDLEFLHERARRNGFELIGTPDGKVSFRAAQSDSTQVTLQWGIDMRSFRPRAVGTEQVASVEVRSWDVMQKQVITAIASSSSAAPSTGLDTASTAASKFGTAPKMVEISQPLMVTAEATKLANSLLDEVNAAYIEAEGIAFGHAKILAGRKLQIQKVGTKFSGTYVVSAAIHRYDHVHGYEVAFTVEGARRRLLADLLEAQSTSHLPGVVQAIVTNNKDPDGMGRVRVKFPWMSDSLESAWARISTVGGGNQRGLYWLPEVNDEVLVAFEQGDMNMPYILGGLYNGQDKPPETADNTVKNSKVAVYLLKTNQHTIKISDDSSDESIEIKDAGGKAILKLTSKSQAQIELTCENGNIVVKGGPQVTITGKNIEVKAETQLMLKGASVNVEASGNMVIKGAMVNIN